MIEVFWQLCVAFCAVFGFGLLYRVPRRDIWLAALGGALGWGAFLGICALTRSDIFGCFSASIVIGLYSETLAAFRRRPATVYVVSAIIPLVPGAGMYYTMLEAVRGDAARAADVGFQTLSMAVAIAAGLSVASAFARIASLRGR